MLMSLPNFRIINRQRLKYLEAKVLEPLKAYRTIVKTKRVDLKATLTSRNREAKQLAQVRKNTSETTVLEQQ